MAKSRTIRFHDKDEAGIKAYDILQNLDSSSGNKFIIEAIIHYHNFLNSIGETKGSDNVSLKDIKELIRNEIKATFEELNKDKNKDKKIVLMKEAAIDEMKQQKKAVNKGDIKETMVENSEEDIKISAKALGFINKLGT